jgi:hypothetical protein
MSILALIFVWLIFWVGKELGGKWLGLTAAMFAAISTAQIDNSFTIWNAAVDPLISLLVIVFLLKINKHKKVIDFFFLSLFISLGTTIHFQNSMLVPTILVALLSSKPRLNKVAASALGLLIPFLPFIYFDIRFHWFWITSVIVYIAVDQYKFAVGNRWLTYAGIYWPETWAAVVGGKKVMAYLIIGILSTLTFFKLKHFQKYKAFYVVAIAFVLQVILFRYYNGQKFSYYANFTQAPVIVLSAWTVTETFKLKRVLGLLFGIVIFLLTLSVSINN